MNKTNAYIVIGSINLILDGATIDNLDYFFERELKKYEVNDFKISNISGRVYGYIGEKEDYIEECEIFNFLLTYKDKEVNLNEEEFKEVKNGLEKIILSKSYIRIASYNEPTIVMVDDYIDEEYDEKILEFINFLKNLKNKLES